MAVGPPGGDAFTVNLHKIVNRCPVISPSRAERPDRFHSG